MTLHPSTIPRWQLRRQRLLHGICQFIAKERRNGMAAGRAYRRGAWRFNVSKLARSRGRHLGVSGMRRLFSLWRKCPSLDAFAPIWKSPTMRKISVAQAEQWTRRAMIQRITVREFYHRLMARKKGARFSLNTLYRALPSMALRNVQLASVNLAKAERAVMAALNDTARKGSAK